MEKKEDRSRWDGRSQSRRRYYHEKRSSRSVPKTSANDSIPPCNVGNGDVFPRLIRLGGTYFPTSTRAYLIASKDQDQQRSGCIWLNRWPDQDFGRLGWRHHCERRREEEARQRTGRYKGDCDRLRLEKLFNRAVRGRCGAVEEMGEGA